MRKKNAMKQLDYKMEWVDNSYYNQIPDTFIEHRYVFVPSEIVYRTIIMIKVTTLRLLWKLDNFQSSQLPKRQIQLTTDKPLSRWLSSWRILKSANRKRLNTRKIQRRARFAGERCVGHFRRLLSTRIQRGRNVKLITDSANTRDHDGV